MAENPYRSLSARSFWRAAVSDVHYSDLSELWTPMTLSRSDRIATAGSCFAQHIGNNLANRGANFLDLEPPPPSIFSSLSEARRFGYRVYSCRYGNIYTSRQLLQLFEEAFGRRSPASVVWTRGNRYFDALRPSVDPVGQDSADIVNTLREKHLARVREMFLSLDVFVFTMGLTEGWESQVDHTMYPTAPGTICGSFNPTEYAFHNLSYPEILDDMSSFWNLLKQVNKQARLLLTVSPVPLTATASGEHVLVATTYSKSTLRAVAGDLSQTHQDIFYFPSYEIISSHPSRGMFYDHNLRTVNKSGVDHVMRHFFSGKIASAFGVTSTPEHSEEQELICDEEAQDEST